MRILFFLALAWLTAGAVQAEVFTAPDGTTLNIPAGFTADARPQAGATMSWTNPTNRRSIRLTIAGGNPDPNVSLAEFQGKQGRKFERTTVKGATAAARAGTTVCAFAPNKVVTLEFGGLATSADKAELPQLSNAVAYSMQVGTGPAPASSSSSSSRSSASAEKGRVRFGRASAVPPADWWKGSSFETGQKCVLNYKKEDMQWELVFWSDPLDGKTAEEAAQRQKEKLDKQGSVKKIKFPGALFAGEARYRLDEYKQECVERYYVTEKMLYAIILRRPKGKSSEGFLEAAEAIFNTFKLD